MELKLSVFLNLLYWLLGDLSEQDKQDVECFPLDFMSNGLKSSYLSRVAEITRSCPPVAKGRRREDSPEIRFAFLALMSVNLYLFTKQ